MSDAMDYNDAGASDARAHEMLDTTAEACPEGASGLHEGDANAQKHRRDEGRC